MFCLIVFHNSQTFHLIRAWTIKYHLIFAMDSSNSTSTWPQIAPLISIAMLDTILLLSDMIFCCSVSLLGVFTNLTNIFVFSKMGFSESSNMSFLALSVFDFLVSFSAFVSKTVFSSFLRGLSIGPELILLSSILAFMMVVATGGSAMMTALISTKRCLCVVFPLKVKGLMRVLPQLRQCDSKSVFFKIENVLFLKL